MRDPSNLQSSTPPAEISIFLPPKSQFYGKTVKGSSRQSFAAFHLHLPPTKMKKSIKNPYQLLLTQNTPIQSPSSPEAADAPVTDPPITHCGDEESVPSLKNPKSPKQIALVPLIALIYFEVAGGPYGEEAAVGAAGPLFAILGFLVFPFIWSIPEALITAELATTFPGNGGFVIWAHQAFGPFWGSMMGSWKFLSGVINLASYPALCIEYLKLVVPSLSSGPPYYASVFTFTSVLSVLNYTGLSIVGYTAVALGVLSLAPFAIMCLAAIPKISPSRWVSLGAKRDWPLFFNTLFWNLNFWDNASTLAGEVEKPQVTFPKALFSAGVLTCLAYLLPLLAAVGAIPLDQGDWVDGYFADAAEILVGKWLKVLMEVGAVLSIVGLFEAQLSSCAYQFLGMADLGFLPRRFGERSKWFSTPWVGIMVSTSIAVAVSCLDFSDIIASVNFLYSLGMLLEFASFLWLRRKMPAAKRPYRVPLGMLGLIIMCLIPSAFLIYVMFSANMAVLLVSAALTALGVLWYFLMNLCKAKQWIEFNSSGHEKVEDES